MPVKYPLLGPMTLYSLLILVCGSYQKLLNEPCCRSHTLALATQAGTYLRIPRRIEHNFNNALLHQFDLQQPQQSRQARLEYFLLTQPFLLEI